MTSFSRLFALLSLVLALPASYAESHTPGGASAESMVSMASAVGLVTFSSAIVLSSPILVVGALSEHAEASKTTVHVTDVQGRKATLDMPKAVADKANLKPGDELTVQQRASGALLSKNKQPMAYLVPASSGGLTKNVELTR